MDLLRSKYHHYPNRKECHFRQYSDFLVSYLQAMRLQRQYPSNPKLNRSRSQLLCKYHRLHLYHSRFRSLYQEFELDDY